MGITQGRIAACPLLVAKVKALEAKLSAGARKDTRVLLVSFDPDRDTAEALGKLSHSSVLTVLDRSGAIAARLDGLEEPDAALLLTLESLSVPEGIPVNVTPAGCVKTGSRES
jgi:cytochrome oxidase Cu insertion factor (SCO1/SenC/PrrC family)